MATGCTQRESGAWRKTMLKVCVENMVVSQWFEVMNARHPWNVAAENASKLMAQADHLTS